MELASRIAVQRLLKQYGITPRKALGQNFVVSPRARDSLVAAAQITSEDTVIEIGAGLGAVTQALARRAKKVIALERDENLCAILTDLFVDTPNVEIICADALKILPDILSTIRYPLVVGNIPYKITGPLVRLVVDGSHPPARAVFMVQKEMAMRITASPPHMNLLALGAQHGARVTRGAIAGAEAFVPKPKVASALITITPERHDRENDEKFFFAAKQAFAHQRKQLGSTLGKPGGERAELFSRCKVSAMQRPQELSVAQWGCLGKNVV